MLGDKAMDHGPPPGAKRSSQAGHCGSGLSNAKSNREGEANLKCWYPGLAFTAQCVDALTFLSRYAHFHVAVMRFVFCVRAKNNIEESNALI